jgi:cytochrome c-type biogenesis protein
MLAGYTNEGGEDVPASDYVIAFGGGVVSFLSPCVLPVVPAYLSVTTGLSLSEMSAGSRRNRQIAARGAGLFILGFSLVFVGLGLSATALGATLLRGHVPITRIAGAVVVVLALGMLATTIDHAWVGWREVRFHPQTAGLGFFGAPLAGAAFAFGWTPCIGPVLGSVLAVAARQQALVQGAVLLAVYAAGLALPFMLTALAFDRSVTAMRWTRRHSRALTRSAAALLGFYGVLLGLDQLAWVTIRLQEAASALGLNWTLTLG